MLAGVKGTTLSSIERVYSHPQGLMQTSHFLDEHGTWQQISVANTSMAAEKKRTNKWLAEKLGKDPATVSKWCTNSAQPNLENLMEIAKCLEVDVNELLRMK